MSNGQNNQAMMAFVWGAALGAGVALLVSPRSGPELRKQLSSAARHLGDTARDKVDSAKHALREGAKDVGDAIATGREAFVNAKDSSGRLKA